MKKTTGLVLLMSTIALAGCNTAAGVGKDVWGGTKYVAKKVTSDDEQ